MICDFINAMITLVLKDGVTFSLTKKQVEDFDLINVAIGDESEDTVEFEMIDGAVFEPFLNGSRRDAYSTLKSMGPHYYYVIEAIKMLNYLQYNSGKLAQFIVSWNVDLEQITSDPYNEIGVEAPDKTVSDLTLDYPWINFDKILETDLLGSFLARYTAPKLVQERNRCNDKIRNHRGIYDTKDIRDAMVYKGKLDTIISRTIAVCVLPDELVHHYF
jgi:hypothetical protein